VGSALAHAPEARPRAAPAVALALLTAREICTWDHADTAGDLLLSQLAPQLQQQPLSSRSDSRAGARCAPTTPRPAHAPTRWRRVSRDAGAGAHASGHAHRTASADKRRVAPWLADRDQELTVRARRYTVPDANNPQPLPRNTGHRSPAGSLGAGLRPRRLDYLPRRCCALRGRREQHRLAAVRLGLDLARSRRCHLGNSRSCRTAW
jgi:hypothetical protein